MGNKTNLLDDLYLRQLGFQKEHDVFYYTQEMDNYDIIKRLTELVYYEDEIDIEINPFNL